MRRIPLLLTLLFTPLSAFALYNGNPSLPMMPEEGMFISKEAWFGFKLGYQFDYVYDRKLKMNGQHLEHGSREVQKYDSLANLGVVTFNFNERAELFGTFGAMSSHLTHHPLPGTKISYHTHTNFTFGVGGRAILAYWKEIQLSLGASYLQSYPSLSSLEVNDRSYSTHRSNVDFSAWQVGLGTSYRVKWFIPYIGVDFNEFREKISRLDSLKEILPSKHATFKDVYPFGLYVGFGLSPDRAFSMNAEVRFISENAFTLSADLKF